MIPRRVVLQQRLADVDAALLRLREQRRTLRAALQLPTSRRPLPREHGTDRGYHQHRFHGERSCLPCTDAHAANSRRQYAERRAS